MGRPLSEIPLFSPLYRIVKETTGHRIVAFALFLAIPLLRWPSIPSFSSTRFFVCAVVFCSAAAFAAYSAARGGDLVIKITLLDALLGVFYLSYFLSYFVSLNREVSVTELVQEFSFAGAYVLMRVMLSPRERGEDFAETSAFMITCCAVLLSAWGLAQHFLDLDVTLGLKSLFKTHHYPVVGSMGNPNFLSEFLVLSFPVAVSYLLSLKRRHLLWVGILPVGVTVYLTYTRLAWFVLALAMAAILVFLSGRRRRFTAAAFALVLAVCGSFFLYHHATGSTRAGRVVRSFTSPSSTPFRERSVIYRSGREMLADAGLAGMGPGLFGYRYLEYQGRVVKRSGAPPKARLVDLDHAHSDLIELGVNGGYVSMAAFCALLACAAIRGVRGLAGAGETGRARLCGLVPLVYVPFFLWSFPFYIPGSKLLFLFSIACIASVGVPLRVTAFPRRFCAGAVLFLLLPFSYLHGRYMLSVWHYSAGLRLFKTSLEGSMDRFHRGILWYPYNGYNYFSLGALLLNHRREEGIARLLESLRYLNNSAAYLNIARAYREHGRSRLAKEWYRRFLEMRPDAHRARQEYRQLLKEHGEDR